MAVDRAAVMSMRCASELARNEDVGRLLRHALPPLRDPGPRLQNLIDQHRSATTAQAGDLDGHGPDLRRLADSAGKLDGVVDEVLASLMTGLVRREQLDGGLFDVAERLLEELVGLAGVDPVVLGHTQDGELHDRPHARIGVRFPGSRVWDLPILAHEFGHHIIPILRDGRAELADRRPLEKVRDGLEDALLADGLPGACARGQAEELLADVLATICCGHTYLVACLCLRAREGARSAASRYPAWPDRVSVMRATLTALAEQTGRTRYTDFLPTPVDPLARAVFGEVGPPGTALVDVAGAAVTAILAHRPTLRYAGGDLALDVRGRLSRRDPCPPPAGTVTSTLDGAWQWRLDQPTRAADDEINDLVTAYCRRPGSR